MIYVVFALQSALTVYVLWQARSDRQNHATERRELVDTIALMKVEPRAVATRLQPPDDLPSGFISPLDDEALAAHEVER